MSDARRNNCDLEPIVICCAVDETYTLPLTVMLRSVVENLAGEQALDVYVTAADIPPEMKQKVRDSLPERVQINWLEPERSKFHGLPLWGHFSVATYDRIMVAQLLNPDIKKAIWLDADTMVQGDISEFWRMELDGHHVLAARDKLIPRIGAQYGVAGCRELHMDESAEYFNAGVMLIDLDRWRQSRVADQALEYLKRYRKRVFFLDQEGLNAVLVGKWRRVSDRWNWCLTAGRPDLPTTGAMHSRDQQNASALPAIIHFTGKLKPWRYMGSTNYHNKYYDYVDSTAWAGWRPTRSLWNSMVVCYTSSGMRKIFQRPEEYLMQLHRKLSYRYV